MFSLYADNGGQGSAETVFEPPAGIRKPVLRLARHCANGHRGARQPDRQELYYSFFGAPVGLIVTIDRLLYGLLIVRPEWREILWLGVTAHPTAEWIASQMVTIRKCQMAVPVRAGKEGT